MGAERVLQAVHQLTLVAALAATWAAVIEPGVAGAAPRAPGPSVPTRARERIAVIDLGPADDGASRRQVAKAIVAGGLLAIYGDGVDDALAGQAQDPDALELAGSLAEAQRAFGALDCAATTAASRAAIGAAAARQAAGLPAPELARGWTYVLLCADRTGDVDGALKAAARLRALGGSTDVPADVWAKYPAFDTLLDHDLLPLTITAEVAGAEIWIDFQRAGVSPLATFVTSGEHVIAAAVGSRRGWAAGTAVRTQPSIAIPMPDRIGKFTQLAAKVSRWRGEVPAPAELAPVLAEVHARIALIRHGDVLEAWGRIGPSEAPRRLGGDDGTGTLAEADRLVALIRDRIETWNDRSPDPDQPLLVEDPKERGRRSAKADEPARWWVYATLAGAAIAGATVLYLHDTTSNTQRVELHYP